MVQVLLALPNVPVSDHASDALAVAVCHINGAPLSDSLTRAVAVADGVPAR
jgi:crossover junction endodeoxyribonuclease RuvC